MRLDERGRSGSAASRQAQSGVGSRGITTRTSTNAATSSATTHAIPNHGWSRTASVKSSCATWIQYSCGSLTKIHSPAAVSSQNRAEKREGS